MFNTDMDDKTSGSDGNTVGASAGFIITTTTTTSSSSSGNSVRHWRKISIAFTVSVTLRKTNICPSQQSPTCSSPFVESENDSTSVLEVCSFSRKSFKNEEASTSSCVPERSSPAADPGVGRNLSSRSCVVNIPPEGERQEPSKLRDSIVRMVQERDHDALKNYGGVENVRVIFASLLEKSEEVEDPALEWNTTNTIQITVFFHFLHEASTRFTILLLLASAGLSFATEMLEQGSQYGWHDGAATLLAIFVLVTFQSISNFKRARKLEQLWKENSKLELEVVRSGQPQSIIISNIAAGDIVNLKKGDQVPADGLVVSSNGLVLDDVVNPIIDGEQNPFVFYGSKVMEGKGSMLVTCVRDKCVEKKTLLEVQTEKENADIEKLSLCVSILIAIVALIRFLCSKHQGEDDVVISEWKGNVTVGMLMKIFERILLKPQGKVSTLARVLSVSIIALQHGMPFVTALSLSFWNKKVLETGEATLQDPSAFATMGIVTLFCIDVTGGLVSDPVEVDKSAVEALINAGVRIILVSEDEVSVVRAIGCELGIFRPEADVVELEGLQIRDFSGSEMIDKIYKNKMTVIGRCLSKEKRDLVKSAQEEGHVVTFLGRSSTSDIQALKEADVGMTEQSKCTTLARESSDIVITSKGSLPPIMKIGRCAYHNIQNFTQLQMTVCISGLVITLVTTSVGESSISAFQLIWVNGVVCVLGYQIMTMDFQGQELIINPQSKRTSSLLTKPMWKDIVIQVICQVSVLLMLEFKGGFIPSTTSEIRKTMVFISFSLCQNFNQLNAMGLVRKKVLAVALRHYTFLVTVGIITALQILVVQFVRIPTVCERLNGVQCGVCFILAALPCGLHCAVNFILGCRSGFPSTQHWPNFSWLIFPFPLFIFSLTLVTTQMLPGFSIGYN